MTVGLLGGTFDPIHLGHLDVARAAFEALSLSRVVLLPSQVPPHRRQPHASAVHRFAMAALAAQTEPWLEVSDLEMRPGASAFTIDTVAAWRAERDEEPLFITGADAFAEIRTWRSWAQLLDSTSFAVVSRPSMPVTALPARLAELTSRMRTAPFTAGSQPSIFLVDAPTAPISSSALRRAMVAGEAWQHAVPPDVSAYITRHRLYDAVRA